MAGAGAAGTIGFVHIKYGLRANCMTQYMPADVYAVQSAFPTVVLQDAMAMATTRAAA